MKRRSGMRRMFSGKAPGAKRWLAILPGLAILLVAAFLAYVCVYYHADETAQASMRSDETVSVVETDYGCLFDGPGEDAALIFYPGAKVEETAYAPLLHGLAAQGMDACLVKMPFRLAILHANAAERVLNAHDYEQWYIGGHSLGGLMAARYAAAHAEAFVGVALLGAYADRRLPEPLTAIVIYGSQDRVLNRGRLERGRALVPTRCAEVVIEGGNHAQFGSYGAQSGDGLAAISAREQVQETIGIIIKEFSRSGSCIARDGQVETIELDKEGLTQ